MSGRELRLVSLREVMDEGHAQLVREGGVDEALRRLGVALNALARQFGTETDQRAHDGCVGFLFDWTYHGADPVRRAPFIAYEDLRALLKGERP